MARNRPLVEAKTPSDELAAAIGAVGEHTHAVRKASRTLAILQHAQTVAWRAAWELAAREGFGMVAFSHACEAVTREKERRQ